MMSREHITKLQISQQNSNYNAPRGQERFRDVCMHSQSVGANVPSPSLKYVLLIT